MGLAHIDRQREIIELLLKEGSVNVTQLSKEYGVRDETIRRDLKKLAQSWDIHIVYGGACINNTAALQGVKELEMTAKRLENYEAKQVVAQKAGRLIEDGDTVSLNSGSTVEYILDYVGNKEIKIVTLNVNVAAKALTLSNVEVYLPGGRVRNRSGMVIGPDSIEFIKSFAIDKCFFGISAICIQRGIMHPVIDEVASNRALLSVSAQNYVVTDSSKLNKTAFYNMVGFDEIQNIIVDDEFPQEYREFMGLKGTRII